MNEIFEFGGMCSLLFHNFDKLPKGSKFQRGRISFGSWLERVEMIMGGMHWDRALPSVVEEA